MQIQLVKAEVKGFGQTVNEKDPSVVLQKGLEKTYEIAGKIDVYNQDRKAAIDSFRCYWQIDYMMQNGEFKEFPLFTRVKIIKDKNISNIDRDEELGG